MDKTNCRTRLTKQACLQNHSSSNNQMATNNKARMQNNAKSTSSSEDAEMLSEDSEPSSSSSLKRRNDQLAEDDRSKRQRQQFQPFQSPNSNGSPVTSTPTKTKDNKLIIYNSGDFLAVRNETNSFFLCRAKQNICKNGKKIKIQWYNNDENPDLYIADFCDHIDFECILTNIRVARVDKCVTLPETEKQRIMNILERAINVEKGINEPPDPTKVLSDGLDISMIGKIEEEELLKKIKLGKKLTNGKHSKSNNNNNLNGSTSSAKNEEPIKIDETVNNKIKKEKCSKLKEVNNKTTSKESSVKSSSRVKRIKMPSTKFNGEIAKADTSSSSLNGVNSISKSELTTIKFEDNISQELSFDEHCDERDLMFDSKTELPFISSYANSKLLIRGVLLKDHTYLGDLLTNASGQICSVNIPRSISIEESAVHYAIANEDFDALKCLMNVIPLNLSKYPCYVPSMELLHSELLLDEDHYKRPLPLPQLDSRYAKFSIKNNVTLDFILKIESYFPKGLQDFTGHILAAIKRGNCELACFLAQEICKTNTNVFNKSHILLLGKDPSSELDIGVLNEYTMDSLKVGPLQIAAINPDPYFFSSIIDNSLDKLYTCDIDGWTPIHYASVCSTFFNLNYLLSIGVSTLNTDSRGNTPLHLATLCNRLDNVKLILDAELHSSSSNSSSLKSYNHHGWTPMHIACKKGYLKIIKLFIEKGAEIDFPASNNCGELTPMMMAAQYGHLDVVQLLLEKGANLNLTDRKNRCPLTHAVMNGHTSIVKCLLKHSANPSCKDMFGNNLFHYALAYGWHYCYEMILKTNVNLKDTNAFGLTPICAAFMKGHIGIIEDTLNRGILSVNMPINDSGITLIMLTFSLDPNETMIRYIKLFVEKFKCDLFKTDYNGNNALHYLLECESKYKSLKESAIISEALLIILQNGCDPFALNQAGICPIVFALQNDCLLSFNQFFKDHYKSPRFQKLLVDCEHFWPLVISHTLDIFEINSQISVSRYYTNIYNENSAIQNILKNLNLLTNKCGDIPIEYFVKSTKKIFYHSKFLSKEVADQEMVDFLEFLLHFYDLKFLQDIFLLHIAAKYSSAIIVKHLSSKFFRIDGVNERNYTPVAIAIKSGNFEAARVLIEMGANIKSKIDGLSCFMFSIKNHNNSFKFALYLSKFYFDVNDTDSNSNTALHIICGKTHQELSFELVRILLDKGIEINHQNKQGETALHIIFKQSTFSEEIRRIFDILLQKGINLYAKDSTGSTALHNLFKTHWKNTDLISVVQMIDTKAWDLKSFVNNNGANLMHTAAFSGNSVCLSYLKPFININNTDNAGYTPLAICVKNKQKDCTLVLLQAEIDLFDNQKYVNEWDEDGIKFNFFSHIIQNGWIDIMFEIIEKAKNSKKLHQLFIQLIQFDCIDFVNLNFKNIVSTLNLERSDLKGILIEFSKYATDETIESAQIQFLKHFNAEIFKESFTEIFSNCLKNWNHLLCKEIMLTFELKKIISTMQHEKQNRNLISLVFWKLFTKNQLIDPMKKLIEMFLIEGISMNVLSLYPIIESGQHNNRYSECTKFDANRSHLVQYSPLIVAVIKKDYRTVKWLLSFKHNERFVADVNFADSSQRTPIMHAILNNDFKMVKLLLDRNYSFEDDHNCWLNQVTVTNENRVDFLARDKNKCTLFHYLVLPFDYFNYLNADVIFTFLWQLLDANFKSPDFINELYKLAHDNRVLNIASLLEKIEPRKIVVRPISKKVISSKKFSYNFQNDYDTLMNQCHRTQRNAPVCHGNILNDESGLPYDVTFTKLDSQKGSYMYNFYKIQISSIADKSVLCVCWGNVGTVGNLKKTFFNSKQEAIREFKRLFYLKSGNEWTSVDGFVPNQEKYRIAETKRSTKLIGFDLNLNFDQLVTIKSDLSIDLRDLIIRWIKCQATSFDEIRNATHNHLNSSLLENCDGILEKILSHVSNKNESASQNKKSELKCMYQLIDLSEEYYNQIGIYGKEFDKLIPIMNTKEFVEKRKHLYKLKSIIFAKELLFCSQKMKELNPVDYIYDTFQFELENVLIDSEEWKFVHLFLANCAQFHFKTISFYRIKQQSEELDTTGHSYLLWYKILSNSIFRTFAKGPQLEPIDEYSSSNFVLHGIKLTNQLKNEFGQLNYLLLCEAKLNNVLTINSADSLDDSLLENKNAIVIKNNIAQYSDYKQHYLSWKGMTVPFRSTNYSGPSEFIMLNSDYVIPRYLVEFKTT